MESLSSYVIFLYDIHDGKILYILTQHSLWNRLHYPFLSCKCQRGEGVKNKNHICEVLSNEEHIYHWEQSKRKWNNKLDKWEGKNG